MRVLGSPAPTPEQLKIIGDTRVGVEVIRGAAGSGKTTTALLRLRNLTDMFRARHARLGITHPVKALVLTYNRTLCGYVEALAEEQAAAGGGATIEVETYAKWASDIVGNPNIVGNRAPYIAKYARGTDIKLQPDFLNAEVEYVMGRFPFDGRQAYLDIERTGRGLAPRVERPVRAKILELLRNYEADVQAGGLVDWEHLPPAVSRAASLEYQIVVVDEAQDFSANQLRSLTTHLAEVHSLTLVIDTAQRLYPRGYTWVEAGVQVKRFYRLETNHRNTVEIASFVAGILDGVQVDDDGTIPDLSKAEKHGSLPIVVRGRFSEQLDFAIGHIRKNIDLEKETVAFLHPLGGGWFDATRGRLRSEGLGFHDITREREWPNDDTNIVLSTMHSAKGLEFDHVIVLGLNEEVTRHGEEADDDRLLTLRRLLAMAAARARITLTMGYKESDASVLVSYFKEETFNGVDL